jgi:hypothetical protein
MKATFHFDFIVLNDDGSHSHDEGFARKEIEVDFIIPPGTEIEDSAWREPKKIDNVIYNITGNWLYITLPDERVKKGDLKGKKEMYTSAGWQVQ